MWPIVERELRVAARRPGTYWQRTCVALVGILFFGGLTLLVFRDYLPPSEQGKYLFLMLFGGAFVHCLLSGATLTADCISKEKREGTLGLLFLTDLRGFAIVLGKLLATSVSSIYAVLAMVPIVALPVQLGGITGTELLQAALVLLNTTFFSLAVGLMVSTLSQNERKAMFGTALVILLATTGPFVAMMVRFGVVGPAPATPAEVWPYMVASPAYPFCFIAMANTPVGTFLAPPARSFWGSMAAVHLASWILLLMACWILPAVWQVRATNSWWQRLRERIMQWTFGAPEARRLHRRRLLEINPFLWLVSRERAKPLYVWIFLIAITVVWLCGWFGNKWIMFDKDVVIPLTALTAMLLKIWVTSEACARLAEERRVGALELLLSTPLTTGEILRGQWLGLQRQFAKPLVLVLILEFFLLRMQVGTRAWLISAILLVADTITLGWLGMWLGLAARNLSRAILGSLGCVLVIRWLLFRVIWFALDVHPGGPGPQREYFTRLYADYLWLGVCLASDFVLGFWWARRCLRQDFREAAASRYEGKGRGWFTGLFGRKEPEPINVPMTANT